MMFTHSKFSIGFNLSTSFHAVEQGFQNQELKQFFSRIKQTNLEEKKVDQFIKENNITLSKEGKELALCVFCGANDEAHEVLLNEMNKLEKSFFNLLNQMFSKTPNDKINGKDFLFYWICNDLLESINKGKDENSKNIALLQLIQANKSILSSFDQALLTFITKLIKYMSTIRKFAISTYQNNKTAGQIIFAISFLFAMYNPLFVQIFLMLNIPFALVALVFMYTEILMNIINIAKQFIDVKNMQEATKKAAQVAVDQNLIVKFEKLGKMNTLLQVGQENMEVKAISLTLIQMMILLNAAANRSFIKFALGLFLFPILILVIKVIVNIIYMVYEVKNIKELMILKNATLIGITTFFSLFGIGANIYTYIITIIVISIMIYLFAKILYIKNGNKFTDMYKQLPLVSINQAEQNPAVSINQAEQNSAAAVGQMD